MEFLGNAQSSAHRNWPLSQPCPFQMAFLWNMPTVSRGQDSPPRDMNTFTHVKKKTGNFLEYL